MFCRDTIVLDDFKTALDRLKDHRLHKIGGTLSDSGPSDFVDTEQATEKKMDQAPNGKVSHHEARNQSVSLEDDDDVDLESALRMDSAQVRKLTEMEKG